MMAQTQDQKKDDLLQLQKGLSMFHYFVDAPKTGIQ